MDCLVCGRSTHRLLLGVDVCRACCVFLRRCRKRTKPLKCKTKYGSCPPKQAACKKCRYDRFVALLSRAGGHGVDIEAFETPSMLKTTERPLLAVITEAYRVLCRNRVSEELRAFAQLPSTSLTLLPNTFVEISGQKLRLGHNGCFFDGWSIVDYIIFEFMDKCIPAIAKCPPEEKARVVRSFYPKMIVLEKVHRNERYFPGDEVSNFCTFTTIHMEGDDYFPGFSGDRVEANRIAREFVAETVKARRQYKKAPITDETEFVAAIVFEMLGFAALFASNTLEPDIAKYRQQLLRELQTYYREVLGVSECSARVGHLFSTTMMTKSAYTRFRELFLMFYVIGIIAPGTRNHQLLTFL